MWMDEMAAIRARARAYLARARADRAAREAARPPGRPLTPDERAALGRAGFDLAPLPPWRDPARRAERAMAVLLAGAQTPADAAACLGWSPERVRRALRAGRLYGLREGQHWLLPRFQFDVADAPCWSVVPGARRLFPRLDPGLHPLAVRGWFARVPQPGLRRGGAALTPRAWLLAGGDPDAVHAPGGHPR
jgi:hypothetical protein